MKKLFLVLLFAPFLCIGQTFKFGEVQEKNSKGDTYISKSGKTLKTGDKLTIGKPIDDSKDTFSYITQGGVQVVRSLENNEIEIFRFQTFKQAAFSGKVYVAFKGYGLIPVLIDYESALESGEIISKGEPLSKEKAIAKLKELKELLELDVITQEDYDKEKATLTPIILGNN